MRRSFSTAVKVLSLCFVVWFCVNTSERQFAAQVAKPDLSTNPPAAPPAWRPLIGEYVLDDQTLIILESDGKLSALFNRTELAPLQEIAKDNFKFSSTSARANDRVVFARDERARVTQVAIGKSVFKRRPLGPEEGSNQLRLEPLRPV